MSVMTDGSLVFDPLSQTDLGYPSEMAAAIACGLEEPKDVAGRFGYEGARWARLAAWKPFLDDIRQRQVDLEASGWVMRTKAKLLAEMLQEDIGRLALGSEVSLIQKLEVYKELAKMANAYPAKEVAVGQAGTGFSITINLDRQQSQEAVKVNTQMDVIDVETKEIK